MVHEFEYPDVLVSLLNDLSGDRSDLRQAARRLWQIGRSLGRASQVQSPKVGAVLERADYDQASIVGILRARKRYRPDLGATLATYARSFVKAEIRRCIRQSGLGPGAPLRLIGNVHRRGGEWIAVNDLLLAQRDTRSGDAFRAVEHHHEIARIRRSLSPLEWAVLWAVAADDRTQAGIARSRGTTRAAVNIIYRRALRKARIAAGQRGVA